MADVAAVVVSAVVSVVVEVVVALVEVFLLCAKMAKQDQTLLLGRLTTAVVVASTAS